MKKSINKKRLNALYIFNTYKEHYREEFYNLFLENILISEISDEARRFVLSQLWECGFCASSLVLKEARDIQTAKDNLIFTPVTKCLYNIYNAPTTAQLINNRGVNYISQETKKVNEDLVIIYGQRNHMPIRKEIDFYATRLADIDMTIRVNLKAHKMPIGVAIDENNAERREEIANKLENGEGIIFLSVEDINAIKAVIPGAPFIIDKLQHQKDVIYNECLTFLGINNSNIEKAERLITDEVNSNNDLIALNGACILDEIKEGFKRTNEVFGTNIEVTSKIEQMKKEREEKAQSMLTQQMQQAQKGDNEE